MQVKGPWIFVQITGTRQLEIASSTWSLRTWIAKTLLKPTSKRSMLKQLAWSAISCNRAIEINCKDLLNGENSVMPSESLLPTLLQNARRKEVSNKNGGGDWTYEIAAKGFENTRSWFAFLSRKSGRAAKFARGLFEGQVRIWVLTDDLWGGAARLGNPDGLFYSESHTYSQKFRILLNWSRWCTFANHPSSENLEGLASSNLTDGEGDLLVWVLEVSCLTKWDSSGQLKQNQLTKMGSFADYLHK